MVGFLSDGVVDLHRTMYSVILPIDVDEQRWKRAVTAISNLPHANEEVEVTVLNVFEKFKAVDEGADIKSDEFYDPDEYPESVQAAVEALEAHGIDVSTERRHGEPAEEIIEAANEGEIDAVVMAARKRSKVGKVLFGSVAQSVILDAEVPVMVA